MGRLVTSLWRYPPHKLGILTGHGIDGAPDIKTFAWGGVLNLSKGTGLMVAVVRKESERAERATPGGGE